MAANFSPEDFLRSNDKKVRRSNTLFDRELQNCEKCLWKSKKYRKQRTELSLQKVGSSTVCDRIEQKIIKNRKTELKKTGIALGVKCAKKFKMDRMDPMDPMDFLRYQKNKIVHLVYLVHLVHKMLIRLPADQTGIRLQRE